MRNRRSNDYYEDEEEGYGEEDYYEEEEEKRSPPKPTREERDFLSYRERLKEKYRQRQQIQARTSKQQPSSTHDNKGRFGSFFGPALPVIAPRVIEESKSIKETHLHSSSAKAATSSAPHKASAASSSKQKPSNGFAHRPKVSEAKRKAQTLKEARDFSFLFSDDADLPEQKSTKNVVKSSSHAKPDGGRSAAPHVSSSSSSRAPAKRPAAPSSSARPVPDRARAGASISGPRAPPMQSNPSRSAAPPSRQPPPPSSKHSRPPASQNGGSHRAGTSAGNGRPPASQNGGPHRAGTGRPPALQNGGAHRASTNAIRKPPLPPSKSRAPAAAKGRQLDAARKPPNSAGPSSSSMQRRPVPASRMDPRTDKARPAARPLPSSSRPPQPSKPMPSGSNINNNNNRRREPGHDVGKKRPAKRPFDDDDDDDDDEYNRAVGVIRKMFRYNPAKFSSEDESDSDMEVGFDAIQQEERRSSKIARQEDEEQLRLIEEEERRERMRKKQKMRHG